MSARKGTGAIVAFGRSSGVFDGVVDVDRFQLVWRAR